MWQRTRPSKANNALAAIYTQRKTAEAGAELGGGFAVTEKAKGAEVVEVALASAFGYGADVVGVP